MDIMFFIPNLTTIFLDFYILLNPKISNKNFRKTYYCTIILSRVSAPFEILLNFLLREDPEIITKIMLSNYFFHNNKFYQNKKSKYILKVAFLIF